jgi:hypothetical protein
VRGRYLPPVVLALVVVQLGGGIYGLSREIRHPNYVALYASAVVVGALWLAALVVWRQRWVWWLYVIVYCISIASPLSGRQFAVVPYVVGVLTLALLVSPQTRQYVGIGRKTGADTRASTRETAT